MTRLVPGCAAGRQIAAAAARWQAAAGGLLLIAIDGPGGSGKTTIAAVAAPAVTAVLVHTDDFFRPGGQRGGAGAGAQRGGAGAGGPAGPGLGRYYDVRRMRDQALVPLRSGRAGAFRCYDWDRDALGQLVRIGPARPARAARAARGARPGPPGGLILLEGVYSAGPELADLVDYRILVDTPADQRLARLRARISAADWDEDWLAAERSYFATTAPRASFDLIVSGAGI